MLGLGRVRLREISVDSLLPQEDRSKIPVKESLTAMLPFAGKIFIIHSTLLLLACVFVL
jgi:hypothetical protein